MTRAEALRWWRAGYQAGHQAAEHEQQAAARWDRLVASFRAQHAADQQARIDVLLLEIIDVLENPQLAEDERILATPTLIKQLPPPLRRVIGDLSDTEKVLLGLEVRSRTPTPGPTPTPRPTQVPSSDS